ncbi:MAG: hemolysin activation/secretion protein [Gammaproteobacteria bacterium]|jgi:hemolysin activation/secretion protein
MPLSVSSQDIESIISFEVSEFIVDGDNRISSERTEAILSAFVGNHTDLEFLIEAGQALQNAHAYLGFNFHRVVLPPQTMDDGIVHLNVVVFALGNTQVNGNQHFSTENILRSLSALSQGGPPNTREIARSLSLSNQQPSRQLIINLKDGEQPDTIDAEVLVKDQKPWMIFGNANNIGSHETGRVRLTAGAQHSNVLGYDDKLSLSYTTSQREPEDVKQYGINYNVPFYRWASRVNLFYSKSDVDVGTVNALDISGAGRFLGGSISHLLLRHGSYTHEINVGLVDKSFENSLLFGGADFASDVRSRPVSLGYSAQYRIPQAEFGGSASFNINTGGGRDNNDGRYAANRFGADSNWHRWNASGYANYFLPQKWLLRGIVQGQYAGESLIPGEQFGLGGVNSVRGFDERSVLGDSGVRLSGELWTPPIDALRGLRILAFLDYGYMDRHDPLPGETSGEGIASTGVGVRWNWENYASVSVDYGYAINEATSLQGTTSDAGDSRWHVDLLLRY